VRTNEKAITFTMGDTNQEVLRSLEFSISKMILR
jgi:hypothetical protein